MQHAMQKKTYFIFFLALFLFLIIFVFLAKKQSRLNSVERFKNLLRGKKEIILTEKIVVQGEGVGKTIILIDGPKRIKNGPNGSLELSNLTIKASNKGPLIIGGEAYSEK